MGSGSASNLRQGWYNINHISATQQTCVDWWMCKNSNSQKVSDLLSNQLYLGWVTFRTIWVGRYVKWTIPKKALIPEFKNFYSSENTIEKLMFSINEFHLNRQICSCSINEYEKAVEKFRKKTWIMQFCEIIFQVVHRKKCFRVWVACLRSWAIILWIKCHLTNDLSKRGKSLNMIKKQAINSASAGEKN